MFKSIPWHPLDIYLQLAGGDVRLGMSFLGGMLASMCEGFRLQCYKTKLAG